MAKSLPHNLLEIRRDWAGRSVYERFEAFVALILTLLIAAVIAVALWRLTYGVVDTLVLRSLNPLEHGVFQTVFGEILTVLIALEFNHTVHYVVTRERGAGLVRKIIVTDLSAMAPGALAAEAALILALGVTHWLMRERDDRLRLARRPGRGAGARERAS